LYSASIFLCNILLFIYLQGIAIVSLLNIITLLHYCIIFIIIKLCKILGIVLLRGAVIFSLKVVYMYYFA